MSTSRRPECAAPAEPEPHLGELPVRNDRISQETMACSCGPSIRPTSSELLLKTHRATTILLDAHECAGELQVDTWQTAVDIRALRREGLRDTDLRWLIGCGLVEHSEETTEAQDSVRRFRPIRSLMLLPRSCFILSKLGLDFVTGTLSSSTADVIAQSSNRISPGNEQQIISNQTHPTTGNTSSDRQTVPIWKAEVHELWLNQELVKRFLKRAPCQEAILTAFTEEGWPSSIFDPLSPEMDQDPIERLHRTVHKLNHSQHPLRIRFFVNGGGSSIHWEIVVHPGDPGI